jgi:hypothetical protein
MTEPAAPPPPPRDDGLRKILTWTFIALVLSLIAAYFAVEMVVRTFDY